MATQGNRTKPTKTAPSAPQEHQVAHDETRILTEIVDQAAYMVQQAARGLRPEGPSMSMTAVVRAIQEHVNEVNRMLGELRSKSSGR